jgi:predicted GNAT family N-acyltransferase
MEARTCQVRLVEWSVSADRLREIRRVVFVEEQRVPEELEIDGHDPACAHVLAEDARGEAVGTGRLLPDGRIGRMAVLATWRNRGIGTRLLHALMEAARAQGLREVHLHAQQNARAFYERHGFRIEGEPYLEAGIPHIDMRCTL